jgi:hypothetical protein
MLNLTSFPPWSTEPLCSAGNRCEMPYSLTSVGVILCDQLSEDSKGLLGLIDLVGCLSRTEVRSFEPVASCAAAAPSNPACLTAPQSPAI